MKIIVQKFGGTSVAEPDARERAARRVIRAKESGMAVVVVVSAMGRKPRPYATDTLLGLLDGFSCSPILRERDLLMSTGEIVSAVVMTHLLASMGHDAVTLTGAQAGIVTDSSFGDAHILRVSPEKICEHLREDKIVVVCGFQGSTEDGEITTLGRGGSDTTATALGVALHADCVEIYTDVDGIMTADPRIVPSATTVSSLSYREVCEMAHLGAKVIHPRAVEIAMEGRVPVWIKNTFSDEVGTLIADSYRAADTVSITGDKVVSGIAHIPSLAQVRLTSEQDLNESALTRRVFRAMADAGISVDLINVSPHEITFTVRESQEGPTRRALEGLGLNLEIESGFAKVSAVGAGMRGVPGVMANIVEALGDAGVHIFQTADSHTSISCLVRMQDMESAAIALHDRFGLAN